MKASAKHLEALRALLNEFRGRSGDEAIGMMLPELGALMVALADELDQAQRKVVRLTWALFWLTVVLAGIGIAQLVASFHAT
jgi:hypothetical protein